jgi:trimeric autotransporter adhesin
MRWVAFVALSFGLSFATVAKAQVVTPLTDPTYLAVVSTVNPGGLCAPPYCVSNQQGIPLNYFATSSSVSVLSSRLDAANASIGAVANLNSQISTINSQILQTQRGLAATAAMANIWMPSAPGKTAWAVNGAAFMSDVGAGFSVAHRLNTSFPLAVTASYGNGGSSNVNVGRIGLMGEF